MSVPGDASHRRVAGSLATDFGGRNLEEIIWKLIVKGKLCMWCQCPMDHVPKYPPSTCYGCQVEKEGWHSFD